MTKKGAVAARTAVLKRRTFTREFKLQVIREIEAGKTQAQVAREYQISDNTISKWRRELRQYKERASLVVVTPILMKLASTNWNAWWAGSPWRTTF
jgi:transposase